MDVEFKVEGLEGIHRNLGRVSAAVGDKAMTRALIAAVRPMQDDARARAPVGRGDRRKKNGRSLGHMRDSIKTRVLKTGEPGEVAVWMGPSKAHFWAKFVEFGTQPHPGRAAKLKVGSSRRRRAYRGHPGTKAQPFLRPAFDANVERVPAAFGEAMWQEIGKLLGGGSK